MQFPREYEPGEAPEAVRKLVAELLPRLIEGSHPALAALRAQLPYLRVTSVELTGAGFYADLEVVGNTPLAVPADFAGGYALITFAGSPGEAGRVLFVRNGCLSMLEGYTYGDEPWPENAVVIDVANIVPLDPDAA
jgi:hypothetical protein